MIILYTWIYSIYYIIYIYMYIIIYIAALLPIGKTAKIERSSLVFRKKAGSAF